MLLLLIACMNENTFWHQYSVQNCGHAEECDPDNFEENYDDQADCQEEVDGMIEDGLECFEDCEFSAGDASDELKAFKQDGCDADEIDLFEVYACDNELEVSICVAAEILF